MRLSLAILLLWCPSQAATYYMATTGSDGAAGTIGAPWATLGKATSVMVNGDTLFMRGGVYDANLTNAPTQVCTLNNTHNMTFSNYPGEVPVFKNQTYMPGFVELFGWTGCTSNVLAGIVSTNHDYAIAWNTCTNCTMVGCSITNSYLPTTNTPYSRPVVYAVSVSVSCVSNWIHFNIFGNSQRSWGDGSPQHDAGGVFQLGQDPNGFTDKTCYNLFENNTNYSGGHDVMNIQTGLNIIRSNYFHQEAFYYASQFTNYAAHRLIACEGPFNVIEYNVGAYSSFPMYNDGSECVVLEFGTNIVRGNVFIWAYNTGIDVYWKGGSAGAGENHIYQNTIAYCGLGPQYITNATTVNALPPGTQIEEDKYPIRVVNHANEETNTVIINNLLSFNNYWAGGAIQSNQVAVAGSVGTVYTNNWTNNSVANGGDPKFTKVSATPTTLLDGVVVNGRPDHSEDYNLQLLAGSTAIDAGAFLTIITSASGSGTSFNVQDPLFFTDGFGMTTGDIIQLQGQTVTATITSVNWQTGAMTVNKSLTWTQNQAISLSYFGTAPDAGAFEFNPWTGGTINFGTGVTAGTGVRSL